MIIKNFEHAWQNATRLINNIYNNKSIRANSFILDGIFEQIKTLSPPYIMDLETKTLDDIGENCIITQEIQKNVIQTICNLLWTGVIEISDENQVVYARNTKKTTLENFEKNLDQAFYMAYACCSQNVLHFQNNKVFGVNTIKLNVVLDVFMNFDHQYFDEPRLQKLNEYIEKIIRENRQWKGIYNPEPYDPDPRPNHPYKFRLIEQKTWLEVRKWVHGGGCHKRE